MRFAHIAGNGQGLLRGIVQKPGVVFDEGTGMKVWCLCLMMVTGLMAMPAMAVDEKAEKAIRATLGEILPGGEIDAIAPSPIEGLYEVRFQGSVFYMSADGDYLVRGEILRLGDQTNVTEQSQARARLEVLEGLDESTMIIFEPEATEHTITVFTDIDCGYCRQFQREMPEYLDRGIRVRYLGFPRSGPDTPSYDKLVAVWCSDDQQGAMTRAKAGEQVEADPCDNPVREHLGLVQQLQLRGTPAVFTESGRHIGGYLSPENMLRTLEQE